MSTLDLPHVDAALAGTLFHGRLHHFPVIDSTNTRALADAQDGAAAGQVYIADEQTAGRGRGGHTWHSEPDRGLYLTVLLRPALRAEDLLKLSLATGLAAQAAVLHTCGYRLDVRWPNDLVTPPSAQPARKLGGILAESATLPSGALKHVAVGIGINLNQQSFPPELAGFATSLRMETGHRTQREALAIALLHALETEVNALTGVLGSQDVLDRFARASSWAQGKHVHVDEGEGYTGVTEGLDAAGLLRVRVTGGSLRTVRHGGVRELFAAGQARKA